MFQHKITLPTKGLFYKPTLITDLDPTASKLQKEIFGPVLVSLTFRTCQARNPFLVEDLGTFTTGADKHTRGSHRAGEQHALRSRLEVCGATPSISRSTRPTRSRRARCGSTVTTCLTRRWSDFSRTRPRRINTATTSRRPPCPESRWR